MTREEKIWTAGWDHGGSDHWNEEHGSKAKPMQHDPSLCPRCASGNDTTEWWTPEKSEQ